MVFAVGEDKENVAMLVTKFDSLIVGKTDKKLRTVQIQLLMSRTEKAKDEYVKSLQSLAITCNFCAWFFDLF